MAKRERGRRAQYDLHPYTERKWIDKYPLFDGK